MFSARHTTEQETHFHAQLCGNGNRAARVPTQTASTKAQVKRAAGCTQVWTAHAMRSV